MAGGQRDATWLAELLAHGLTRASFGHAGVSGVIRLGSNQNNAGNIAGTDFGTFFGTFCSQFGTFVPFFSQNRNLAIFGGAVFFIVLRVLVVGAARFELATPSPPD